MIRNLAVFIKNFNNMFLKLFTEVGSVLFAPTFVFIVRLKWVKYIMY